MMEEVQERNTWYGIAKIHDEGAEEDRRTGDGGGVRLEENTKWMAVAERGLVEVVVLTLHSFVYPPEPSIRPAAIQSSSTLRPPS